MADPPAGPGTEPSPAGEATHAESSQPSPEYMDLKHRVHRRLVERINLERLAEIDAPRVRREVREAVAALVAEEDAGLERDVGERLIEEVLNEVFGLGPLDQDFRFGPGTATVYIGAGPNATSFRAEPCTSAPPVGARARPSAHRR